MVFTKGITAVVGPNGSGKSNISDAIRWVLGEQSAKSLRCSRMEDVIFNGTQQRKKTGYAQVTLSIDNSDRALHFDGDEVAVTRRYYRSGNSEYLINNTVVRLQDIHELFMDTGLGRDGYSMIGQGKIDSIVATRGEDRREIFEEAAGISRFRYKKAEAERRLERTEENLVRLRDIISELEGRVEPLRIQSEKAVSFLAFAKEKRGLEIALWLRTLDKSAAAVREQEDKLTVAKAQYDEVEQALEAIRREGEEVFSRQGTLTAEMDQLRRQASETEERASACRSRAAVLEGDIKHHVSTMERIRREIESASLSEQDSLAQVHTGQAKAQQLEQILTGQGERERRLTEELLTLKTDETASADRLSQVNAALAALTAQVSDAKVAYMTASTSIRTLSERMEVVDNTIRARTSQIETLEHIIADYRQMSEDCAASILRLEQQQQELQEKVQASRQAGADVKAKADKLRLSAQQTAGRAAMLEDLERNLEGFGQSVKTVMREAKKGTLSGIHGPVSRVIKTPEQYSTAIEIALGAAMQNIVTTDDKDAKNAIAYLKKHEGGRATFLPLSTIKGRELTEKGLSECPGFVGIASELCTCEEQYRGILLNLLGRIVVAENLDRAVEIARQYGYRFRVVTLDGQVVNTGGSLTGGSLHKNTGLLGRASEIEKLKGAAHSLEEESKEAYRQFRQRQEESEALETELQTARTDITIAQSDKIKIDAEIRSRQSELESTRQALLEARKEREDSVEKMEDLTRQMEEARVSMDALRGEISANEETVRQLTGSKDELVRRRESMGEQLQEARISVLSTQKDLESVRTEIENARLRQQGAKEQIEQSKREIEDLLRQNEEIRQEIASLDRQDQELSAQARSLQQQAEQRKNERTSLEGRTTELQAQERTKTSQREQISGELARLEERRSGLQKQFEEINAKLWDEYELTRREAELEASPIDDPGRAQRRLGELKQKIRSLGSVNVSAIEEYKEVKARYEFMSVQIGDVEKSKAELLRLIGELTKQMREIFIDRFRLINDHFSRTFVDLFGGGKASLSLSDPENVLTAGIEISVQPPGKIVSHIELLSGGEKALVAIALYFAIMKVSPAPFCVMDEIEAALDDVNVTRFAEYLRRMNDNTQFICITHRRGTMEEADVLYGVTMQDQGISKLLELNAGEIEQKLGIKA